MTTPRQDPWISQTGRPRVAVEGRLVSGEPCTVVFICESGEWLRYPLGLDKAAVRLTDGDIRKIVYVLADGQPGTTP